MLNTSYFDNIAMTIPVFSGVFLRIPRELKADVFDIHFAVGQPLSLCGKDGIFFLTERGEPIGKFSENLIIASQDDIRQIFSFACGQSVFSHEDEIKKGYVIMKNGCRVGIGGEASVENGIVRSFRNVTSLSFRIPRDMVGCGDRLFLEKVDFSNGVLLVGEPSSGKTTMLRDVARSLSCGRFQPIHRTAVIDERGEISGEFDMGPCTDVIKGCPKSIGFEMAVCMLSPEYIICDELSPDDVTFVEKSVFSGVPMIASVHGRYEDMVKRPLIRRLLQTGAFGTVVCLFGRSLPCQIKAIIKTEDIYEVSGCDDGHSLQPCRRSA